MRLRDPRPLPARRGSRLARLDSHALQGSPV